MTDRETVTEAAVARAIGKALGVDYDHAVRFPGHWEDKVLSGPNEALAAQILAAARAALPLVVAGDDPTNEMLLMGARALRDTFSDPNQQARAAAVYRAMSAIRADKGGE